MSERIAFRSPNWLGDAVMSTVVLPALRRRHSEAVLEVVVPEGIADVFACSQWIDGVAPFRPGGEVDVYRSRRYDHVLLGPVSFGSAWRAMRGRVRRRHGYATSRRGWLLAGSHPGGSYHRKRHQVENYRELAGLLGSPAGSDEPEVRVDPAWRNSVDGIWPAGASPRVVLQPGATYGPAKRWEPSRFAAVARELVADGADVAIVGGEGDRGPVTAVAAELDSARNLCGRTTIGELAAVLEGADLVITNDSGPMHLAAAVGTPTVAIFGSTSPLWTGPWGGGHRVVQEPMPCNPCFQRECSIGYGCLDAIRAEVVLSRARARLNGEETAS